MERYIILCDHDLEWAGRFKEELEEYGIFIKYIELLEDVINERVQKKLNIGNTLYLVMCSRYIIQEYLLEYDGELLHKIMDNINFNIFIIADTYSYSDEYNMIKAGCIDYQCRSVPMEIIVQRVKNIIKREFFEEVLYEDEKAGIIYAKGDMLKLTKKEKEVLSYLLANRDKVISKTTLLNELWNVTDINKSRVADTILKQLRKKLKEYDVEIITYYGRGVLLKIR